ncbi:MAG: hypothetical protein U9R29_04040, partial [Thermodesulfobacteriota bacterium]|nr:hypothetical protein [Thermodesulfobacteriota bacterium]
DLPRFANMMFNAHCARIESKIKTGVSNALYYETDLDWDMAGQSFSRWWWHAPSFDINDLLAGVDITNSDVAQMFTAKATFGAFFKDSVNAMATMNMEVQTYLFAIFPEVIYNDVAAMYNGAFQQAGIDARFEIRPFSN